jgi:hypothetical protein
MHYLTSHKKKCPPNLQYLGNAYRTFTASNSNKEVPVHEETEDNITVTEENHEKSSDNIEENESEISMITDTSHKFSTNSWDKSFWYQQNPVVSSTKRTKTPTK